jgi:hypothetical protein
MTRVEPRSSSVRVRHGPSCGTGAMGVDTSNAMRYLV